MRCQTGLDSLMTSAGSQLFSKYRIVWPIFGVFFCESLVLGSWIPRIPDIKDAFALSDALLGVCLLIIPLGTIMAFVVATRLLELTGMRNACRIWLPFWALGVLATAFVSGLPGFMLVLLVAGFAIGVCEVAMNTKADMIESDVGFRIMSRCHGFWSLGSMVGALIGSALAQFGWSLQSHFGVVLPIIAVVAYFISTALPPDAQAANAPSQAPQMESKKTFHLPQRAILLLCLMPVGVMLVEGAFIDWSALFMRDVLNASPIVIGVTYAFFSIVMAITRLFGDSIAQAIGDQQVVLYSGLAAFIGLLVFSLAPTVSWALVGATLSGLGVAIVYPLSVSAAARRPGDVSDNVAALSLVAFVAFLLAPPMIGFISEVFGLRIALLTLLPIVALTPILASEVSR